MRIGVWNILLVHQSGETLKNWELNFTKDEMDGEMKVDWEFYYVSEISEVDEYTKLFWHVG